MQSKPQSDCAVAGIGTDIADVGRIKALIEKYGNAFLEKTFTDAEIAYCSAKADAPLHFAARFAAKEAMAKALGTGFRDGLTLKSVSVGNDGLGAPFAVLDEAASKRLEEIGAKKMLVSLSHLKEYAQAFAVATR